MESVIPFDWSRMFLGVEPPLYLLEIIFRVVVIYAFAVFMLRYTGKRGKRQLSHFELVIVIALGSATGDSMLYPEVPILYAWIIIATMVGLERLLSGLQLRSKWFNTFLEGDPRLVLENGRILDSSLQKESLRRDEFMALLRIQEIDNTGSLRYVFIEENGQLGVLRFPEEDQVEGESTFPGDYEA